MPTWYVKLGDKTLGPISSDELRSLANNGKIQRDTLVHRGDGKWALASKVKGLFPEEATDPLNYFDFTAPGVEPTPVPAANPFDYSQQSYTESSVASHPERKQLVRVLTRRKDKTFLDLGFNRFATPVIASAIWGISLAVVGAAFVISCMMAVATLMSKSPNYLNLAVPIVVLVGGIVSLLIVRMSLEAIVVLFKIRESIEATMDE